MATREQAVSEVVDEKYYQVVPDGSLAKRVLIRARDRIYDDFIAAMEPKPTDKILDVGVSDVVSDDANVVERKYPYHERITACGLGDAVEFKVSYPKIRYVKIPPNQRLPFDDGAFEVATSNAVLEHVGSRENQSLFVGELCRVARRVFITVPHRYFPVEHHTALPFVHYSECLFAAACRATGKIEWSDPANLILMSRKRLFELAAPIGRKASVGFTGLRLGPFSSNLYLAFGA
jgi:Methyltransferase domain